MNNDGAINIGNGSTTTATTDTSTEHGKLSLGPSGITSLLVDSATTPATQQFDLLFADGTRPTDANWSVDDATIGSISPTGLFQTRGLVGGVVTVSARIGNLLVTLPLTVTVKISGDNPAGLSADQQTQLQTGGTVDANFSWLYPYDKTVFPLDLPAPTLQFSGQPADAFYVKVISDRFTYDGFLTGTNLRLTLPDAVWKGLTYSNAGGNSVRFEVSKLSAGQVTGPKAESWIIAKGKLKGFIYYNTYRSPKANRQGAVMRIKPSATEPDVLRPGCTVCHSVSASGNRLISGIDWGNGNPKDSGSFNLSPDTSTPIPLPNNQDSDGRKYSFGALTPDGKWFVNQGGPSGSWAVRGLSGALSSKLYETDSGAEVSITNSLVSLGISYVTTPAFSPGGSLFSFSRHDIGQKDRLVLVDFDATNPSFSNVREIVNASGSIAGWPAFFPDNKALVYHEGSKFDTETNSLAQIHLVDFTHNNKISTLQRLNGLEGTSRYLPWASETDEEKKNYEPTVLPAAVGGYYWVIFTSRRAYGNLIAPGVTIKESGTKGSTYDAGNEFQENSPRKKLWIAAIDLDYPAAIDPSHPAFYLPGQEFEAGNMRAFSALEPCRTDGSSCESGLDCCGGFCRQNGTNADGAPILTCLQAPADTCSQEDEKCSKAADCCGAPQGYQCINEHCARPRPDQILR